MRHRTVKVGFSDRDPCAASVWRTGNTLCATFYAYGSWTPVETFPLTVRERPLDILTLAREMYHGDSFTVV